ncbi:hypothetical protein KXW12_004641 [Aspergillus fumigatus]|nr:hypothetical protein KXW63_008632 [Aspergillus fumigatus]KAH2531230.1 hypothetical protein KXW12_004641 [Aspergillus fumigatus]KAH2582134.1 hypothetical protein KXV99_009356 [Aspergillus fumigatus]KAH3295289.1 hypothetical protein KXW74_009489 [Aspergillus fumigatus]
MREPEIFQLSVAAAFEGLTSKEQLYAHHTASGFSLSNIGNYFGSGDQKFHPDVSPDDLEKLANGDPTTAELSVKVRDALFRPLPDSLGVPSDTSQSTYYLGEGTLDNMDEVSAVSKLVELLYIFPENTRLRKSVTAEGEISRRTYDILQASIGEDEATLQEPDDQSAHCTRIRLIRGDHKEELKKINQSLSEAMKYAANCEQQKLLSGIAESFASGDLNAYRQAQRVWVKDKAPKIETVFGFVEPYRDPLGVRAEFEGIVGISDQKEPKYSAGSLRLPPILFLSSLGRKAFRFWLIARAWCFPGSIFQMQYNDIRQEDGFKNIIFANRMIAESQRARGIHMIHESERKVFQEHRFTAYYIWVVLHEILGHGTSKLLQEDSQGHFNFDREHPPLNPLTGKPIDSWYGPGETWTGVFTDLSTTVDECRAELAGAYLIDVAEILQLFGCTVDSKIKPADVVYNLFQQLGVDGLRALENYNPSTKKWGQAHSRASSRHISNLTIRVNRFLLQEGKASLGRMLLRLHIYRCTADMRSCREFYEDLTTVHEEALGWREVVLMKKDPPLAFCHANTFLQGDRVILREYEPTVRGLIQSWAERDL